MAVRRLCGNVLGVLVGAVWSLALGAGNPFVGSAACAPCHPAQFKTQTTSHHANALQRAAGSRLSQLLSDRSVSERNGTSFEYEPSEDGLVVTARQDNKSAQGLIEWIFGAGALAWTPVGRDHRGFFEHRVSWYHASDRPGMTLGHTPQRPADVQAALGRRPGIDEITRCFGCHASGVRPGPNLDWMEAGVRCERCHGPGGTHVRTTAKADIVSARATSPKAQVAFCAECHRSPTETLGMAPEQSDPMLVRFAPVGLSVSRCFVASGRLTCLTCHNPHEDARKDTPFYNAKCQSCHPRPQHSKVGVVAKSDCLSCHMPKRTPVADLTFTDHRIRVVRDKR